MNPDVDGRRLFARVGRRAARAEPVDVGLYHGGADHGKGAHEEPERDTFEGSETNAGLAQGRVQQVVEDGDEDDQREGVEVGEDVVRDTVQLHGCGLRGQVVGDLVVGQP